MGLEGFLEVTVDRLYSLIVDKVDIETAGEPSLFFQKTKHSINIVFWNSVLDKTWIADGSFPPGRDKSDGGSMVQDLRIRII